MDLDVEVTREDIDAAMALGATGAELLERSVHSALDRLGCPREGRKVTVTMETITIDLPPGWEPPR